MSQTHDPEIVTLEPRLVAVLRETVPMSAMADYFGRAFSTVARVVADQGVTMVGPPVGLYYGVPTDRPVTPAEGVTPETLPGGQVAQVLHVGTYDAMEATYGRLTSWLTAEGFTPGPVMWETYLTEPDPAAPETAQTLIDWPVS